MGQWRNLALSPRSLRPHPEWARLTTGQHGLPRAGESGARLEEPGERLPLHPVLGGLRGFLPVYTASLHSVTVTALGGLAAIPTAGEGGAAGAARAKEGLLGLRLGPLPAGIMTQPWGQGLGRGREGGARWAGAPAHFPVGETRKAGGWRGSDLAWGLRGPK